MADSGFWEGNSSTGLDFWRTEFPSKVQEKLPVEDSHSASCPSVADGDLLHLHYSRPAAYSKEKETFLTIE